MTLRLNGSTSGYVEIDAPATAGSNTLVLPNGNGTNGQYLQTNGSGGLSWATNDPLGTAAAVSSTNFQFNSGYGSVATAYGCRAWVNFNGTGTIAVRASGNVSSLTDHATGEYSVNFTNSMPDANYVCHMNAEVEAGTDNRMHSVVFGGRAVGSVRIHIGGTATEDGPDPEAMMVTIFR